MTAISTYVPQVQERRSNQRVANTQGSTARQHGASRLRLTRRGRFVLTSLAAGPLVALALIAALNGGVAVASSDLSTGSFEYVTVHADQSLWEIAESIAPSADPREVISDLVRLNQLDNAQLHPGDRLAIPEAYSR